MCLTVLYKDRACKHMWAAIVQPCAPGMGFNNCPSFFNGEPKEEPPMLVPCDEPCPLCDLHDVYDRNLIRRILKMKTGYRWGLGPSKKDYGVDIEAGCCAIM